MGDNKYMKNNKAVALSYKEGYNAPKILAKGKGEIADNILNIAKENKIKVFKDENLVEELIKLDLHEEIPPCLYEAVANIIYFVYNLDRDKGEQYVKQ